MKDQEIRNLVFAEAKELLRRAGANHDHYSLQRSVAMLIAAEERGGPLTEAEQWAQYRIFEQVRTDKIAFMADVRATAIKVAEKVASAALQAAVAAL